MAVALWLKRSQARRSVWYVRMCGVYMHKKLLDINATRYYSLVASGDMCICTTIYGS